MDLSDRANILQHIFFSLRKARTDSYSKLTLYSSDATNKVEITIRSVWATFSATYNLGYFVRNSFDGE